MQREVETATQKLAEDRPTAPAVLRSAVGDVESYSSSVAGIELEAVRAGAGHGMTAVTAAQCDRFTFTSSNIGFPMLSRTTLRDDMTCLAYMQQTVTGSRWCEMSLAAGDVVTYAPSSEHTARNLPGTQFMFIIAKTASWEEHAEHLGVRLAPMPKGEVNLLPYSAKTCLVSQAFETFSRQVESRDTPSPVIADGVMSAVVLALSEQGSKQCIGASSRIDSRHVVHTCIDYAAAIQRIPSISELCIVAHVSERTLREAFTREYAVPPSQYFRAWALDQAHRRLIHQEDSGDTVTGIATELGFDHLGRFAGHYKKVYGEAPSATLHTER
jgi:AraC-like DNA-binding protein